MEVMAPSSTEIYFGCKQSMSCGSPDLFGDSIDYLPIYASAPSSPARKEHHEKEEEEDGDGDYNFEFNFCFDSSSFADADDLFDHGRIKPLKPPSPKPVEGSHSGRERRTNSSRRRAARSLSPVRRNNDMELYKLAAAVVPSQTGSSAPAAYSIASFLKSGGSRKWRLRDLFLFRSASDGRVTNPGSKDPLKKYSMAPTKTSSFSSDEGEGSFRKGRAMAAAASPHEKHYTANRAAKEEMKRKTALPYRPGIFGFLPGRSIARGLRRKDSKEK